jgi:hypothetical protein
MTAPELLFLGYIAKKPWKPPKEWDPEATSGVEVVCSVSNCLAEPSPDWVDRWDFNRATCHATAEAALAATPPGKRGEFVVFAYWLLPAHEAPAADLVEEAFVSGLPALPARLGPTDYEGLGFDVVALSNAVMGFGCSPLSCNGLAASERVNRFCLVDELDRALELAKRFSAPGAGHEPDTYYVVKVARDRTVQ